MADIRINKSIDPDMPHVYKGKVLSDRFTNNVNKYVPPLNECEICGSLKETKNCIRTIVDE